MPQISAFATAIATADAIRARQISATELVEQTLQRIDRVNPSLNAIIWHAREQAMARAADADRALAAGTVWGPLHGVPMTIKESFAYRGSANAWGLPPLEHAISPHTAVAVARLESAGAIVVGKTNVPVMLGDWQSYNPIHGTTNNPWDLARTPGGSTGGGAAAVAADLGCLTLGTDLSGSIRTPAHFCGVYGHKPSLGLVSADGLQPGPWDGNPGYPMDIAAIGPLARSARDLAVALDAIGGPNGEDRSAWTWRMPAPRHSRLEDFRVGVMMDDPAAPLSADVARVYERTLSEIGRVVASLDTGWPSGFDVRAQLETFQYLVAALVTAETDDKGRASARKRFEANPGDVFAAATVEPHGRWLHETQKRLAIRALWQTYFQRHDVFLLPVSVTAAFPHDHSEPIANRTIATPDGPRPYLQQSYWTGFAGVAGLPVTVAPVGLTREGLPVGIQIVAPMWEDGTSIEFAALLAERFGGFVPPPSLADQA